MKKRKRPDSVLLDGDGSPHSVALSILARFPERIKGNREHYSQVRIFNWLYLNHPHVYQLTHATPNGGLRHKATALKLVAEGQKKGYPDMSIDMARGGYHGMRLELKYGSNPLSPEQQSWLERLSNQGYYCFEARSTQEAIEAITQYINLPFNRSNQ